MELRRVGNDVETGIGGGAFRSRLAVLVKLGVTGGQAFFINGLIAKLIIFHFLV
jgi:hypothetical protein